MTLAIEGGQPVRRQPFPGCNTIGAEERRAVLEVLDSGVLSQFVGAWGPDFFGGPRVQALEAEWARYFGSRHAVSMNSATSCLYAAVGAAGVGPGDEVIVSPYTMSASAAAAIVYGGIPVFADIDPDTFCLDPRSVAAQITDRTRAVIGVEDPVVYQGVISYQRDELAEPDRETGLRRSQCGECGQGKSRGADDGQGGSIHTYFRMF